MQKITNLYRLNTSNKIAVLVYLLKRVLRLKTTEKQRFINDYYYHLINFKGILKEEGENYYISHYPNLGVTIKLRKRPSSDFNVFAQIYHYNEYAPVVETFQKHFPNHSNLNIIDAGSNVGLTSVYLTKYFSNSNFITIEPDSSNFESMSFNLKNNGITNTIKIKGGLWSKNANLKLVSDFRDKSDWSIRVEETCEEADLKAFSIQYLIEENNFATIEILKIDIEGSEKEVFTSPNSDVSFLSITKCVAIEIHDEFQCREAIYEILKSYNFEFFNSGELTIGVNKNLV